MKLTRHNGRAGKNGVYNPKHNDRSFDIANSEHIDEERAKQNLYWDCYNGFRNFKNPEKENELSATFEDVEQLFYRQRYRDFVTGQNERNVKNRHPERNKETGDLLKSKKTCPEETVYQIGTLDNHVPPELLIEIVTEFMEIANERFGSHVHILNWALHLDESTPHIHERHVFDCENQYGEIAPQQEKALEALGFELPEPEKPVGRKNNRKMTFDSACRVLLFDVAKKHGLQLEEEPEYGGRAYLEKQDYILFKQKEQLAAQEQKLEELTMKIEDVEALVDEVADIAYDKAVEVVADTVKLETHKEDIKLVEQSKAWVLSPERKASKKEVEYAVKRLDGVIGRITNAMKSTIQKIQTMPDDAERKGIGTPATRSGIIEKLVSSGFVERRKSKKITNLLPTSTGTALITVLPEQLQSPQLTAEWEHRLKEIERGEIAPDSFMDGIAAMLHELVQTYKPIPGTEVLFPSGREVVGRCPRCGAEVTESPKGFFCENRACSFVLWKNSRFFTAKKKALTKSLAAALLKNGRAPLKGCYSEKTGKTYDAVVLLEDDGQRAGYKMVFDNG